MCAMPSPRHRIPGRLRLVAALALSGSLALTACSGDKAAEDSPTQETTEQQVFTVESPLTGLQLKDGAPENPVLAVKIDNSSNSRPQVGLGSADMVAEELVEGGATRLAVFYHSKVPGDVGPVRSMRATDIGIVRPLDAVLVASGGAPQTVARVREAGIRTVTEGGTGYYRASGRSAPYNLFMRLGELAKTLEAGDLPPAYLPFDEDGLPKGKPATTVTTSFSRSSSSTFRFEKGAYVNTDSFAGADGQFRPKTVVALRVQIGDAGYADPAGNPVPETKFTGTGEATVFTGGRAVRGTWAKNGLDAPLQLTGRNDKKLSLPPGKVWLALVPASGGGVSYQK
jgi:hypothetical protein